MLRASPQLIASASCVRETVDTDDLFTRTDSPPAADLPLATAFPLAADVPLASDVALAAEVDEVRLIWPQLAQPVKAPNPDEALSPGDDVQLLANGVTIQPMARVKASYSFVVPRGTERVALQSQHRVLVDPGAPYLGGHRCLGVRVRDIIIRSRAREAVIPADDPRLVSGWHDSEKAGTGLWRWTDGLAELPWDGVTGPAVVTIRCSADQVPQRVEPA
jgi:hypothetical protein